MDWTQASVIEHSLKDVIDILQSKPVQRDLEPGIEIARMMNRVAIAHLSIERAMKFLIKEAESGNGFPRTHRLSCLYEKLKQDDPNSVEFLDHAFEKAVRFFNYNPNSSEQSHFVSLSEYLGKVGGADAFNEMRYWEVGVQEINEMVNRTSLTVKNTFRNSTCFVSISFLWKRTIEMCNNACRAINMRTFKGFL